MLQVKTFTLPQQEAEANAFLASHKPADQGINFAENFMFVFYEDFTPSKAYELVELQQLLESAKAAKLQQEIASFTMQNERDGLNMKANKGKYEELSSHLMDLTSKIKLQGHKITFLEGRIADLTAQL